MRVDYAIVFVSDMKRSVSFYRDVLEMPLRFESSHWTEFATEGATLALHLSDAVATKEAGPGDLQAGGCRPGLRVADLEMFNQRMLRNGVRCIQEPAETFGARLAQYADPDGLVISVSEESRAGA